MKFRSILHTASILITFFSLAGITGLARAQEPVEPPNLLTVLQHSGYVMPEHRFFIDCQLKTDGHLISKIHGPLPNDGFGVIETIDRTIKPSELTQVQNWIECAKDGPFEQRQNPCDIGGYSIMARRGDTDLVIALSEDCGIRVINKSQAAKKLADWTATVCKMRWKVQP
jgi:hypothetical protein